MKLKALSLILACTLMGGALAKEPAKISTAEQQATKAEIDSLIARIEELSKKLGPGNSVNIDIRRHDGPWTQAPRAPGEHGPREVIIERRAPMAQPQHTAMKPKPGIGIVMAPNSAANGVLIGAVTPEGPAAKAGLRSGDVLLSVDGKTIGGSGKAGIDKARELLSNLKVGQTVQLTYARTGKAGKASVKVDNIGRVMMFSDRESGFTPRPGNHPRHMFSGGPDDRENIEIMAFTDCEKAGKKDCAPPRIFEAMRWQGLNLASLDAQLGRYFGTDKGVLVISAGPGMKSLQSGDVIQRVESTATESPRDVMRVLRAKKVGEKVNLAILRERKAFSIEITAPEAKAMQFLPPPPPTPPAPPAPPAPPRAPGVTPPPTPVAPPAPPAPPIGMRFNDDSQERIVWVSQNDDSSENAIEEVEIEISK
ncbi:MAG: PDZ domain-containing protein [Arenimonas sp.]